MRRSAAPSKLGNGAPLVKRIKFTPPTSTRVVDQKITDAADLGLKQPSSIFTKKNTARNEIEANKDKNYSSGASSRLTPNLFNNVIEDGQNKAENTENARHFNESPFSLQTENRITSGFGGPALDTNHVNDLCQNVDDKATPSLKKKQFSLPLQNIAKNKNQATLQETSTVNPASVNNGTDASTRYLSVVWCKMSKKKHKKWEGDAVLVTHGRSVTLYDMEGKIISKGSGYKTIELLSLKEDETLFVGGKEIQVMSQLTEEQFKSGKCFSAANCGNVTEESLVRKNIPAPKPFANPLMKNSHIKHKTIDRPLTQCNRFDPTAPGALVMRRPNAEHQWTNNKGQPITDVVVDPYLSSSLRPHQREGVAFLYECVMGFRDFSGHGAILADDMGLGKTLQCIAVIWTLLKQGPYGCKPVVKKVIVITPGSLVKNWFQEFKKWLGTERLNIYAVSSDKKVQDFVRSNNYPVLVISYEMFVRCYDDLKSVNFDLIICDEGHRLKNTAIKTTSLIMSLATRRRIVLTGTPVQNDLQEFFSIVEFCNPGILGTSAAFRRVFEEPIVSSRQPEASIDQKELGADRAAELSRLTHMFVLRRTQEINNQYLPPKVELVIFCRPSSLQLSLYRQLIRCSAIRHCLSGNLTGSPHLICIGALKQLCNHPGLTYRKAAETRLENRQIEEDEDIVAEESIYDGLLSYFPESFNASTVTTDVSGKLEVLSQILTSIWSQNVSEKIVLVSNHTRTLDFLQVFCTLEGYTFLRLDGSTPTSQRQEIVNRFNNKFSPQRIFLLSSKAGGVGLNLIGASRLILYDIDWNPANDLQAMARVWRDGQTKKVHIYRLLTVGTIEEKIYQRQITKQGLSETVMELSSKNNVKFSLEDLKDLFTLNEETDCETHDMLSCSCNGDPYNKAHSEVIETDEGDDRDCQLGGKIGNKQKKSTNLTMAELLHWKHWQGHFSRDMKTWYLDKTGHSLSYVFWHEINQTTGVGT